MLFKEFLVGANIIKYPLLCVKRTSSESSCNMLLLNLKNIGLYQKNCKYWNVLVSCSLSVTGKDTKDDTTIEDTTEDTGKDMIKDTSLTRIRDRMTEDHTTTIEATTTGIKDSGTSSSTVVALIVDIQNTICKAAATTTGIQRQLKPAESCWPW